ncbi:MAG: universal stress protein [Candidatus Obscuribacterales bacterium]|nr:universal stress protein [Candidatus Obscuribacterales bacterium]
MKVLVPVEDRVLGSELANFIAQHQWRESAEFCVIHVVEPFFTDDNLQTPLAKLMVVSGEQIMTEALLLVDEVAQLIQKAFPSAHVSKRVIGGPVKEEIVAVARDWGADLIVAGSHGRNKIDRFLLGSVSLMLISEAPCPVLLVKPGSKLAKKEAASGNSKTPMRILIALDETKSANDVIKLVNEHNWQQPTQFKLVSVIANPALGLLPGSPGLSEFYEESKHLRSATVRKLALKLRDHYHSPEIFEEVLAGDPKKMIIEAAKEWHADVIVVGCRYGKAVQKMIFGSVSLAVLCAAPCPVLMLRQKVTAENDAAVKPACHKHDKVGAS